MLGAVVVTETVTDVPVLLALADEAAQVASEGAPVQVKVTAWLNPPRPVRFKVYDAGPPGATVCVEEELEATASVKSQPVPLKLADCGLPAALSVIWRVPVAAPAVVGEKVTAIVQVPLAGTGVEVEQVVPEATRLKGPVTTIALMARLLPPLVSVTVCALLVVFTNWPAKADGVDRVTPDADAVPVPLRLTACVLGRPPLLSVIVTVPGWRPVAVGSKVTAIVQLPPADTVPPGKVQVDEGSSANSLAPVVIAMSAIVSGPLPVLFRVTLWGVLLMFTVWFPKLGKEAGTLAVGAAADDIFVTNEVEFAEFVGVALFVVCFALKVGKSVDQVLPVT
jgi:hypothetical protein